MAGRWRRHRRRQPQLQVGTRESPPLTRCEWAQLHGVHAQLPRQSDGRLRAYVHGDRYRQGYLL